jgi:hypothetical protein
MTTTRTRWIGALLTCLGFLFFVATPAGAITGHNGGSTPAKKSAHPKGFFVSGPAGQVTNTASTSALVRDDSTGGLHVVTTVASPTTTGQAHIAYLTHFPGDKKWASRTVPGLHPTAGGIQVEAHLSTDGRRVFAVIYECDGVFVTDASVSSRRLAEPTQVSSTNTCSSPTTTTNEPPVAHAVAMDGHQIGILLPDPAQDNEPAIWTGAPSGTFTPGPALPTADSFVPSQIERDPVTGRIVVVGQGSDGTNEGVYVTTQRYFEDTWTGPTKIATLNSPTSDYAIEALTTYDNSTWVGLQRPVVTGQSPKHTLFVDHGKSAGGWVGVIALTHSTSQDSALRLVINPDTGHLHAAFTRVDSSSKVKKSGVMEEALLSHWSKPKFFSHWYRDTADQIVFNTAGRAVIGYQQR